MEIYAQMLVVGSIYSSASKYCKLSVYKSVLIFILSYGNESLVYQESKNLNEVLK